MEYCSDFRYDLKLGNIKEEELAEIFANKKIEVKYDQLSLKTGNIFVEYESRGKKSGISKSEAEYYCYAFGNTFHLVKTQDLKDRCRKYLGTSRDTYGGDNNSSKGILLPITELF
jgi:hypothetical protein